VGAGHARFNIFLSIPGISEITAFTMLVEMPELGKMSNKQATSLAGLVCPMRFNPDLKAGADIMSARGKPSRDFLGAGGRGARPAPGEIGDRGDVERLYCDAGAGG